MTFNVFELVGEKEIRSVVGIFGHNIWHNRAKIVVVLKSIMGGGGGGELAESACAYLHVQCRLRGCKLHERVGVLLLGQCSTFS